MKKFSLINLILFLSAYGTFYYYTACSFSARVGKANWENIKNIQLGMDSSTVIKIMGIPSYKHYSKSKNIIFLYENIPLESVSPEIVFDSTGKVIGYMSDSLFFIGSK
jgi:hypothetical protein